MKAIPLLLLCAFTAHAATPPPLSIKRQAPLRSPAASVLSRDKPMLRVASTENPYLPMKVYHRKVQSEYGTDELTGEALQPANQSVLFEIYEVGVSGGIGLAFFPAYPVQQPVFAGLTSYEQKLFIRAKATPTMPTGFTRLTTTGPAIWTNPNVRGAFARRGVR